MYVRMCVLMYVCLCVYVFMFVCMYVCTHVCMYACVSITSSIIFLNSFPKKPFCILNPLRFRAKHTDRNNSYSFVALALIISCEILINFIQLWTIVLSK